MSSRECQERKNQAFQDKITAKHLVWTHVITSKNQINILTEARWRKPSVKCPNAIEILPFSTSYCFLGGQFAFARQTSRQAKTSRLISSKVCGKKCVEFFYFMENFKNSEFKLSTRKDNKEDRVWFNSGGGIKFEDWTRGLVEINADDGTCQEVSNWLTLNYTKMFAEQTAYKENVCNRGLAGRAGTSKGALPSSLVSCEIQWSSGL